MNVRFARPMVPAGLAIVWIGFGFVGTSNSQNPPAASRPAAKAQEPAPAKSPAARALEALSPDEGNWEAAITFWLRPGAEPIKSRATVTSRLVMGGMYLEQRFEGAFGPELGNKTYTTTSYTGFNPTTGEYEAVRMASTHSTMIVVRGKATESEKGLSMELAGEYMFAGGKATQRDVIRHDGPDKCVIESWMSFGGTPEFKGAEMVLTRAK